MYKEIGDFISSVGFPVFVGVFVLWRIEPVLREMLKTLEALKTLIEMEEK